MTYWTVSTIPNKRYPVVEAARAAWKLAGAQRPASMTQHAQSGTALRTLTLANAG